MLKIKLARFGKKKQPHYRIVINEARDKRDGKYVEMIGNYAPTLTPKLLELDIEKYEAWLKKGAQPTDTVLALVTRFKSGNAFPVKANKLSKKAKAKAATAAETEAADKAAAAAEAAKPAEEVAPEVVEPTAEVAVEEAAK